MFCAPYPLPLSPAGVSLKPYCFCEAYLIQVGCDRGDRLLLEVVHPTAAGAIMRNFLIAWLVLAIVVAILALVAFGYDLRQFPAFFQGLSIERKALIFGIGILVLWLIGTALWQADRLSKRDGQISLLQKRLDGVWLSAKAAEQQQGELQAGIGALLNTDPEETLTSLQQRLTDAERRTAVQQTRNEPADMQQRVQEIQDRQKSLRQHIGEVVDARRASDPILIELRDRQKNIETLLGEIETHNSGKSLAEVLDEAVVKAGQAQVRLKAGQNALETLTRLRDELSGYQEDMKVLQDSQSGLETILKQANDLRSDLARKLDVTEGSGSARLAARAEALTKNKNDAENRMIAVKNSLATVQTIRKDLSVLLQHQAEVERALVESATDEKGTDIAVRMSDATRFLAEAEARIAQLKDMLAKLNRIKSDLVERQTDLEPLLAPDRGIEFVLGQVKELGAKLIGSIEALESSGKQGLAARVDALAKDKYEAELRIEALKAKFAELEAMRSGIGSLFTGLMTTLNQHAGGDEPPEGK